MKQIGFKSLVTVILLATTALVSIGAAPNNTDKWKINTSSGKIPEGWEPFGHDYNDKQDPFLLRRKTDNWNDKQQWEIKTSSGRVPVGWEPFGWLI